MSFRPIYKKRDWVPTMSELIHNDTQDVLLDRLYRNPRVIDQLKKENMLEESDMELLMDNPGAIEFIEENIQNADGYSLTMNPAAAHLFNKFSELYAYENRRYDVDFRDEENIYDGYTPRSERGNIYKWDNQIDIYGVALNPQGIDFIESSINIHKTRDVSLISNLCWNHRAIHLLEIIEKRDRNLLDFDILVYNPNAVHIIERNMDKITREEQWNELSFNINAVHLMRKHMDKIHWQSMSQNSSDEAICLLKENFHKIDWEMLNLNHNPKAIEMLKNHPSRISYFHLSENPAGIDLLEQHMKVSNGDYKLFDRYGLVMNTSIFILDTDAMKAQINKYNESCDKSFVQELMEKTWHPQRVQRYMDTFHYDLLSDNYVDAQ